MDAESLRLLLPAAHKHLLATGANSTSGTRAKEATLIPSTQPNGHSKCKVDECSG